MNPACSTVNVRPAIVSVPDRGAPRFSVNRYATLPFPVPIAAEATVIHGTLLAAVHAHVLLVVDTLTVPLPSLTATLSLVGEIE
jgi:hypothetical protein